VDCLDTDRGYNHLTVDAVKFLRIQQAFKFVKGMIDDELFAVPSGQLNQMMFDTDVSDLLSLDDPVEFT
jgi:hypothetical protein